MKLLKNEKGFTLIELIMVTALLVLVLSVGFSYFSFGLRIFSSGTSKADLQFNARMAADNLTNELRYISSNDFNNIDLSSNAIKARFNNINQEYTYFVSNTNLTDNNFSFELNVRDDNISNPKSFKLESSVVLLNVPSGVYEPPVYMLNVTTLTGLGTTTGAGPYLEGSLATVTATPEVGYNFTNWTGDKPSNSNPHTFSMPGSDISVYANFQINDEGIVIEALNSLPNNIGPTSAPRTIIDIPIITTVDTITFENLGEYLTYTVENSQIEGERATSGLRITTVDVVITKGVYTRTQRYEVRIPHQNGQNITTLKI